MRLRIAFLVGIILVGFAASAGLREWTRRHDPPEWRPTPVPVVRGSEFDNPWIIRPGSPEWIEGMKREPLTPSDLERMATGDRRSAD